MKYKLSLLTFLVVFFCTPSYATLITFQVDMSGETVSADGVHIIGSFNGFNTTADMLTETSPGSNLYTITLDIPAGDYIEYKFLNGNNYDTGEQEIPPTGCALAINNNRALNSPETATTLDVHAFSGCPTGYEMITVNFCVDMLGETTTDGIFLIGEFYGGFGSFLPLSLVPGQTTIYCISYDIPEGVTRLNYKYTIGDNYSLAESIVGACAQNTDRFFNLTGANPDDAGLFFYNTCNSSILPIELASFAAKAEQSSVVINWETLMESQTDYFLIEKSVDGRQFSPLHREPAAGDSQIKTGYEFWDKTPSQGENYYRLSTYDWDGSVHVEGVRKVKMNHKQTGILSISPNPGRDHLQVALWPTEEVQNLTITDVYGRVLQTTSISPNSTGLRLDNLNELNTGVYYLQLQSGNSIYTKPFIKN